MYIKRKKPTRLHDISDTQYKTSCVGINIFFRLLIVHVYFFWGLFDKLQDSLTAEHIVLLK